MWIGVAIIANGRRQPVHGGISSLPSLSFIKQPSQGFNQLKKYIISSFCYARKSSSKIKYKFLPPAFLSTAKRNNALLSTQIINNPKNWCINFSEIPSCGNGGHVRGAPACGGAPAPGAAGRPSTPPALRQLGQPEPPPPDIGHRHPPQEERCRRRAPHQVGSTPAAARTQHHIAAAAPHGPHQESGLCPVRSTLAWKGSRRCCPCQPRFEEMRDRFGPHQLQPSGASEARESAAVLRRQRGTRVLQVLQFVIPGRDWVPLFAGCQWWICACWCSRSSAPVQAVLGGCACEWNYYHRSLWLCLLH